MILALIAFVITLLCWRRTLNAVRCLAAVWGEMLSGEDPWEWHKENGTEPL